MHTLFTSESVTKGHPDKVCDQIADAILDALLAKNPHVRIVANAVTLETVAQLTQAAKRFTVSDIAEISVAKPRRVGGYSLMTAQNPVYVFTMQNP